MEPSFIFDHRNLVMLVPGMVCSVWFDEMLCPERGGEWDCWGERVRMVRDMVKEDAAFL